MSAQTQPPGSRQIVFWDIDGTLLETSMERLFLRFLLRNRYVHPYRLPVNFVLLGLTSFPPRWYRLKALYIRNISETNIREWVNTCFRKDILPRLRPGACETIAELSKRGARQVLLSGTLHPLAVVLGEYVGVTEIIAASPEMRKGRYTGRLRAPHPHSLFKKIYVEDWLRAHQLEWKDVTAVANHNDDQYLLEASGRPIAAFSDAKLERIAQKRNWTVISDFKGVSDLILSP